MDLRARSRVHLLGGRLLAPRGQRQGRRGAAPAASGGCRDHRATGLPRAASFRAVRPRGPDPGGRAAGGQPASLPPASSPPSSFAHVGRAQAGLQAVGSAAAPDCDDAGASASAGAGGELNAGAPNTLSWEKGDPGNIVVDALNVYWAQGFQILGMPLTGGSPVLLADQQSLPHGLAVDGPELSQEVYSVFVARGHPRGSGAQPAIELPSELRLGRREG